MTYSASGTFSTISNISVSVNRSNFIFVIFKDAYHANRDVVRKQTGLISYS